MYAEVISFVQRQRSFVLANPHSHLTQLRGKRFQIEHEQSNNYESAAERTTAA
jgi:hypothetical protein